MDRRFEKVKGGVNENDDAYFVIKITSGFYDNPKRNLLIENKIKLILDQQTKELFNIMLDQRALTQIRTVKVGVIAATNLHHIAEQFPFWK